MSSKYDRNPKKLIKHPLAGLSNKKLQRNLTKACYKIEKEIREQGKKQAKKT